MVSGILTAVTAPIYECTESCNNRGGGVTRRLSILKMMKLCKRQMQLEGPQEKAKQWLMGLEKMNVT
ncbi:hypothetical protein P8452_66385 [Trifolium repens]|nr:hypothetical protein P8452_66385 [Trifolium repens]